MMPLTYLIKGNWPTLMPPLIVTFTVTAPAPPLAVRFVTITGAKVVAGLVL